MPEFAPGEAKVARAPITVRPAGLSCQAEVFLGPSEMTKVATSGLVPFTSTGASQNVRLPVIMPSTEGSYHVYIDVYIEGILIVAYQAIEDVVIVSVPVAVYRCVYCPSTFSTEAALIDHMERNHPGKPYLVYAYLSKDTVGFDYIWMDGWSKRDWITVYAKMFTPLVVSDEKYSIWFFFHKSLTYGYWPCAPSTGIGVGGPAPEGFYVRESGDLRPRYLTYFGPGGRFVDVPFGTYPLYSTCYFVKADGSYSVEWENVDTGLTITVV